jgi:hypothetical protein
MKDRFFRLFSFLLPVMFFHTLISCTPQACQDETLSLVKANFYKTTTGKITAPDSVTLYGLGRDTAKIYSRKASLQTALIPLDAAAYTSVFVLKINNITDTVTVKYSSYPHLVSKECGYTFFHIMDTVYGRREEIVFTIKNKNITTFNDENIRIFY